MRLTKLNSKESIDFHPIKIKFDFTQMERTTTNKIFLRRIKKLCEKISTIFSSLINIKNRKIIKTSYSPKEFCDEKIQYHDRTLKKGIKVDLLIYPIFDSLEDFNFVYSKICSVDSSNFRPIIAILMLNEKIDFEKILNRMKLEKHIFHHIMHILGFSVEILEKKKKILAERFSSFLVRDLFEKTTNYWHKVKFYYPVTHIKLKRDIMSKGRIRSLLFSSITLGILQETKFYQINLSSCGCSLNGDCEYYRHPLAIYISKNKKNKKYNILCYLNENVNSKCSILNDTFIPKKTFKKINNNIYQNYFNGSHSINKLQIWKSSPPKNIDEQIIYLLSPKKNGKCKNPQRTVFLHYPNYINYTNPELKNYIIEPYKIKNKNMIIYHSYYFGLDIPPFKKIMKYNKIYFRRNYYLSNFFSFFFDLKKTYEILGSLGKYQVYNFILNSVNLFGNKLIFYHNYKTIKKKFPNDFNFHPESFILSEDKEILQKKFKNYIQTENDLWIYKPPKGSLGYGIKFMKNEKDFLKYSFINKYISNPHLLYGKKYHIRMYVIVTGILPLKIYIFNEGQVMKATSDYSSKLENIEIKTSMLTNVFQNRNNPGYEKNVSLDKEKGSEWTIKVLSKYIERNNGNWTKIWEEIKDIGIKTILVNYEKMQNTILNDFPNLRSNNIIHRYGFDIMIDDNLKPWLLEINTRPAMELYNIINKYTKLRVETDRINLIGLIPFNHITEEPLDKEMKYKDKIDEAIQLSICEFERPHGGLERIFPVKNTLNYYKQFIQYHDKYNKALWKLIENGEIE